MVDYTDEIYFFGGANSDDENRAIPKGDYREFWYCGMGDSFGKGFCVVNSRGTVLKVNPDIATDDFIMGCCAWVEDNSVVYALYKPNTEDEYWKYNISSGTHTLIAQSDAFNFDTDWPIYHMEMLSDIVKWTDGRWDPTYYDAAGEPLFNGPFNLNLTKALAGEYTVIDRQVISVLKYVAPEPISVYVTDSSHPDNKLRNELSKFRIQWIYENNEPATPSHYGNLALPYNSEFISGNNWAVSTADNAIDITFNTGPEVVKKINIIVSINDGQDLIIVQTDKQQAGYGDDQNVTYRYYGDMIGIPIQTDNYSRVPITAFCQSILPTKEIAYTNIREGFDKPDIEVTVERVLTEVPWVPGFPEIEIGFSTGPSKIELNWVDNAEFIVQAGQNFSGVLTFTSMDDLTVQLSYTVTAEDIENALLLPTIEEQMGYILMQIAIGWNIQIEAATGEDFQINDVADNIITITGVSQPIFTVTTFYNTRPNVLTGSRPSLKTGALHPFGIIYFNDGEQDGTVLTDSNMNLFVPFPPDENTSNFLDTNDPYRVHPRFFVDHVPPIWATHYRFVYQPTNIASFFQTTIVNMVVEQNRWKISLQNYYQIVYDGVKISHEPRPGDILRFIKKRVFDQATPVTSEYVPDYIELEIMKVDLGGGTGGFNNEPSIAVWVPYFDITAIDPDTFKNQLVEIYSPRLTTDDTNILPWRVIGGEAFEIIDAHKPARRHEGSQFVGDILSTEAGTGTFVSAIDLTDFIGYPIEGSTTTDGVFTGDVVSVIPISGYYLVTVSGTTFSVTDQTGSYQINLNQVFLSGVSYLPAVVDLNEWGDVYLRLVDLGSGYSANTNFYWWVEDPEYSAYFNSRVIETGLIEVESPYARLVHRQASIHTGAYIDGANVNNTCTISLNNENIVDLNETFGQVYRTIMGGHDGKTLKCIQERKENSIYIQGTYVADGDGEVAQAAFSSKTFSQRGIKVYSSLYGTVDPGSVILVPNQGIAYYDRNSAAFIQSLTNGQQVISEDFKYVNKTREITDLVNAYADSYVRSYVNEQLSEIGWAFRYGESSFIIVSFDYKRRRFRSVFDYNFRAFCNHGRVLVGFGSNNQLYLHNQASFSFHGNNFDSKVTFVSNSDPDLAKRPQDIGLKSDKPWWIDVTTEPNETYPLQVTFMESNLLSRLEGANYWTRYKRNIFTDTYHSQEYNRQAGDEMRDTTFIHLLTYKTTDQQSNVVLFAVKIKGVFSETVQ